MFGFDPGTKPEWSSGITTALLLSDLLTGKFIPAKGNVLLIGEAASLEKPSDVGMVGGTRRWFGGGGIGLAVKSGILAAEAIAKAADTSREAAGIYLTEFERVLSVLNGIASDPAVYKKSNWRAHDRFLDQLI
jgi:flavin-dependent dehydrogenase